MELGRRPERWPAPGPVRGATGVEFLIATLDPQVEEASFDLNRRFWIDPNIAGRTPGDVYDLRDLRQACVLTVLAQRYASETREIRVTSLSSSPRSNRNSARCWHG